jgi:hypothetical protein
MKAGAIGASMKAASTHLSAAVLAISRGDDEIVGRRFLSVAANATSRALSNHSI